MILQKQLFRHKPDEGQIGDCYRTVLACLLDLHPTQVPHFAEMTWGNQGIDEFNRQVEAWLNDCGYTKIRLVFAEHATLDDVLKYHAWANPGRFYLLSGFSRTGCNHVVIGLNDQIHWDPSQDDSGIVGPMDHGHYEVEYLATLAHKAG